MTIFHTGKWQTGGKEIDFFARFVYLYILTTFYTGKWQTGGKEMGFFAWLFTSITDENK